MQSQHLRHEDARAASRLDLLLGRQLKNLALTITGMSGSCPLPRTLWKPHLVTSMTGAEAPPSEALARISFETRVQSLSRFMVGQYSVLRLRWNQRMPILPKW